MSLKSFFTFLYFTLSFLFFQIPKAQASVIFSDNFDDQNLNDWSVVRNFQWQNPQEPCLFEGNNAEWSAYLQRLGIEIFGPGCFTEIIASNLWIRPGVSYTFEFDITLPQSTSMDRHYTLRYKDSQNTLGFKILGNTIYIEKMVNGIGLSVPGSSTTFPFEEDHTYHISNEIYNNHHIKVFIDGQSILDFQDTEPYLEEGTIGFRASVGAFPHSISWFDNAIVSTLDQNILLDVPYVSQKNSLWANIEYDRASEWASRSTSIKNWGCALTSAVMILKFNGIEKTPVDNDLTPQTLNSWLNSQADGYLNSGQLNWVAISRMTQLLHNTDEHSTVLEYHRNALATIESIKQGLDENHPVIVHVPNHFIVANGWDKDTNEIRVLDPYDESKQFLSEYMSFDQTRSLIPTHTDLSYILIAHQPELHVSVNNLLAENAVSLIADQEFPTETQPDLQVLEISKPEEDTYTIDVDNAIGKFSIPVFTYTQYGLLSSLLLEGYGDGSSEKFLLTYQKNGASTLQPLLTLESLSHVLSGLWYEKHIKSYYAYWKLQQVAGYMQQYATDSSALQRYFSLFQWQLDALKHDIDDEGIQVMLGFLGNMR